MQKLNPKIKDILINGSPAARKHVCLLEPLYFNVYYLSEFFDYKIPPFHFDMYQDIKDLENDVIDSLLWAMYRESAKTSVIKTALVVRSICYKLHPYINWDSYDKSNAESALYDVANILQTNKKIISDFGHLYFRQPNAAEIAGSKPKRIGNFVTENGVKVEAFSTQESTRGRVYGNVRPSLYIFDDFETSKTVKSRPITASIKAHINEAKAGLGPGGKAVYLGNYISEEGIVHHIMHGAEDKNDFQGLLNDPRGRVRVVNVVDDEGNTTWPDKYVKTDAEAAALNINIKDKRKRKISLETKMRDLGKKVYDQELMNNPASSTDYYGDREILKDLMKQCTEPKEVIGKAKYWRDYNPRHRYAGGGDTAEGTGNDHNAAVYINFSTRPAVVVATFKDNLIKPDAFAWQMKRMGDRYGQCFLVPEINNTGYATVSELIKDRELGGCGYPRVYQRIVKNRTTNKNQPEFGFRTTHATKPDIVAQFFKAVQDGELKILDKDLLDEMYHYRDSDMHQMKAEEGMTRHFDLLIAGALAWEGNKFAEADPMAPGNTMYKSPQNPNEYPR